MPNEFEDPSERREKLCFAYIAVFQNTEAAAFNTIRDQ